MCFLLHFSHSRLNSALFHFGISPFYSFSSFSSFILSLIFLLFTFYFTFAGLRVLMEILLYFLVSHILLDAPEATAKQWKLVLLLCLFFGCDAPFPQCSSPCSTHCLRRTACWLSLWLPPLWSSAMGEGKGPETEGFWQKTLAFYCPCYCCCIYLAAVKAVEECTFLRLSRFCVLPAPLSPRPPCPVPTPSWHPLRGSRTRLSFYSVPVLMVLGIIS